MTATLASEEHAPFPGESHPKRTITLLYFATASTATRLTSELVELPTIPLASTSSETESGGFPLSRLAPLLEARHAGTDLGKVLKMSRWSVDAEMVDEGTEDEVLLKGGEEVAVICPVSGG